MLTDAVLRDAAGDTEEESCRASARSVAASVEEDEPAEAEPTSSQSSETTRLAANSSSLGLENAGTAAGEGGSEDGGEGGGEGGGGEGGEGEGGDGGEGEDEGGKGGVGKADGLPSTAPAASAALGALWGVGGSRWAGGRLCGLAELSLRCILQSLAQQVS